MRPLASPAPTELDVDAWEVQTRIPPDPLGESLIAHKVSATSSFIQRFSQIAAQDPTATAAIDQRGAVNYGELEGRSNQLAFQLAAHGVGPEVAVGVYLSPGVEVLVAILAIWRCRGVYLPLDPTHPEAYVRRMVDEAKPRVVVANTDMLWLEANVSVIRLDAAFEQLQPVTQLAATSLVSVPHLSDTACLFYTSGTTGRAKGVLTTQLNVQHYLQSAIRNYRFQRDDVFLAIARTTFSISLFELLAPLRCGGSVRILQRNQILDRGELCRALESSTVVHAGPSLLRSLFRYLPTVAQGSRTFDNIRHASSGGDLVTPAVMHKMRQVFPNAELYTIYGCTEISCMGTSYPIPRAQAETVTRTFVGVPFPNVTMRVLDEHRHDTTTGEVGEIYFAGQGVARGYLHQPELSAQRFVEIDGERYYSTGDLGRLHPDGCLEILGRRDFQVQLHGIRLETIGIERAVEELGLAAQCAVVAKKTADEELQLVAFVVQPSEEGLARFRRRLATVLPDYMIPQRLVVLDAMPVTINGKLDRHQLLALAEEPTPASDEADTSTPLVSGQERAMLDIFKQVLRCAKVGLDDNFFDLGGDSLQAMLVLEQIATTIGVTIPPQLLFEAGTVRALSEHSRRASASTVTRPIPLNQSSAQSSLFMLSGVQIYRELAKRLADKWSVYGLITPREFDSVGALGSANESVEQLAQDYLAIIKSHQPRGPYYLLGYSFAGIVAYELAQQLRALDDEVGPLVLVDAVLPEWSLGWRFRLAKLKRVRSVPLSELVGFARRRFDEVLKSKQPTELMRQTQDHRLASIQERRASISNATAARYAKHMRRFSGSVCAVTLGKRLELDPLKRDDCGWGPFVDSLRVCSIDCDHFQVMAEEPYVTQLASIVDEAFGEERKR
ncbi:MAG: AMP-binding protein [Myxococcales bacterium]